MYQALPALPSKKLPLLTLKTFVRTPPGPVTVRTIQLGCISLRVHVGDRGYLLRTTSQLTKGEDDSRAGLRRSPQPRM